MSSTNPPPPLDTLIGIKIAINGENRRFKLPLRELGANTLPDKLRTLLAIPSSQIVIFERYSDSASNYIKLDSNNPAVYKQLYRAAKAKGKLRIRAVMADKPSVPAPSAAPPVLPMPEHHLTPHCYVPPTVSDPPKVSDFENLMRTPSYPVAPWPQSSGGTSAPRLPYSYTSLPTPVPVSNSKESFAESLGLALPRTEAKRETFEDAPIPRYYSPRHEQYYAELASLNSKDSKATLRNPSQPLPAQAFTICCNSCDAPIPNAHYHCSKCDDGDFDLCETCYNNSIRCNGDDHWLVKRGVKDGKVTSSSTETVAPKKQKSIASFFELKNDLQSSEPKKEVPGAFMQEIKEAFQQPMDLSRTCNSCVTQYDESNFVTCTVCDDYDLCIACHVENHHGHHPSHAFMPASEQTTLNMLASKLLAPGRNVRHAAICDGCDKDVVGVRHKCVNCPDWDYCSSCVKNAARDHPGHRFVPLYEPIPNPPTHIQHHYGIHCDGPLCADKDSYIVGDRYKCAVCHDTDFCANCEALPTSGHNASHPLIKFKTPIRSVSVTTLGETDDGTEKYTAGDKPPQTSSKATETNPAVSSANAATQVQTVADVTPTELAKAEPKDEPIVPNSELQAHFLRDAVADGSVMLPSQQFEQIWTLRNPGPHAWPVGCSVRFIGGDTMFNVDPNHPSNVSEILKATESNTTDRIVEVGGEVDFKVVMRSPEREGNAISYWRLKAADGSPFGHKLWCDIRVCKSKPAVIEKKPETMTEVLDKAFEKAEHEMIFPKLEKESPVSSTHETMSTERVTVPDAVYPGHETDTISNTPDNGRSDEEALIDDVENLELSDSETDDGFLTDEEYEMLAASDDEFKEAKNGKK